MAADHQGNLYIGVGVFRHIDRQSLSGVARWDGTAWRGLNPEPQAGPFVPSKMGLATDNQDNLYAIGNLAPIAGVVSGVVRWTGARWQPLSAGLPGPVRALAVAPAGRLYAAGIFGQVALDSSATWQRNPAWEVVEPSPNWCDYLTPAVVPLAVDAAGHLYQGGRLGDVDDQPESGVARWDGQRWQALGQGTGVCSSVYALLVAHHGTLYAGGDVAEAEGLPDDNVIRWDGSRWQSWGEGLPGPAYALATDAAGHLYAGGGIRTDAQGEVTYGYVARRKGKRWMLPGGRLNGPVRALAFDAAGGLCVGGDFTAADSLPLPYVARWAGAGWHPLGADLDGRVRALARDEAGNVYAGGAFARAGTLAAANIARWDGIAWHPLGPGLSGEVWALATTGDRVYAGGAFTALGDWSASTAHVACYRRNGARQPKAAPHSRQPGHR